MSDVRCWISDLIHQTSDIIKSDIVFGGLAQLARAPALHAGGQRFESVILHWKGIIGSLVYWLIGS